MESASHEIQPEVSSTIATTTSPESNESNAVHSTTIQATKSEDSSVLSKHSGKNFMDLPRELRDMIYYHALVPLISVPPWLNYEKQDPIRLGIRNRLEWNRLKRDMAGLGMAFPKTYPKISPPINTALFCTNHTLRTEAEAVFYKHNTFTLHARWFWLGKSKVRRPLPAAALSKLRKLYVGNWYKLIKERVRSIDEAREAQIKAVREAQ